MRPNGNDQGFLASYFEFVDCNFIKEPRPNVAKGHERVFLRTLLSNFPTICNRQRIADSIAGFFVDRYLAFKRCTRRGPNKSLVIYPHPFLNFTRIDLGHGSSRAHSKGRHNGCKCGVEFQSNHFPNWLGGTRIHYRKHCSGKVAAVLSRASPDIRNGVVMLSSCPSQRNKKAPEKPRPLFSHSLHQGSYLLRVPL